MANFTPEELEEILQQLFDVTGKRQYIGARYVPIFGRKNEDSIIWDNSAPYEPLTIVLYQGNSYTSRTYVPEGVEITNAHFWANTGNYNAQVEQYRRDTAQAVEYFTNYTDEAVEQVNEWLTATQNMYNIKPFAFNTVADMQAAHESLYVGAICRTSGFYAADDNGGAWYVITDNGTANNMDIIGCGDTLLANLVITDAFVTPEMFGAHGDTETNDVRNIQASFDYAKANGKQFVMVGTYRINDTLTFSDCNIKAENSTILYGGTHDKAAIELSGRLCDFSFGVIIDAGAWSDSSRVWDRGWHGWVSEAYIGLKLTACRQCKISANQIIDFTVGVELYSDSTSTANAWNTFHIQSIRNCKIAYHILNDGNTAWNNANNFYDTDISYQSSNTQFVLADIERYGIKQEQINVVSVNTSCNANLFVGLWFEFHNSTPFTAIYVQNMNNSVFDGCRYEVSGLTGRKGIIVDLTSIVAEITRLENKYVNGTYLSAYNINQPKLPEIRIIPNANTSYRVPAYAACFDCDTDFVKEETFTFGSGTQMMIGPSNAVLDNYLYATVYRGSLDSVKTAANLSSAITDDHLTTHNTRGNPVLFVTKENDNMTLEIEASQGLPFIQLFDATGNQLTSDSENIYMYAENMYQIADENYSYYSPNNRAATLTRLSFASDVKYIKVILSNAKDVTLRSKHPFKIDVVPPNNYTYLNYPRFRSNVVPTDTTFPLYTKIWDFRDLTSLGGYWQLEISNGAYDWAYHGA